MAAILKINDNYDGLVIMNILELKCLEFLGVAPIIDHCASCGSKANIKTLSATNGGFICTSCYRNEKIVSEKTLKLIRAYYYVDIQKLEKIVISEKAKNEINSFLDEYYDRYTGLYLKSKEFLKFSFCSAVCRASFSVARLFASANSPKSLTASCV